MEGKNQFHTTLEKLRSLQQILNEKFQLEKKINQLPQEISLKEEMVHRMKENFLAANTKYQELKGHVVVKQDELHKLQEHREKFEKKIADVNSQRDYEQIDRAIKENFDFEQAKRNDLYALEKKLEQYIEEFAGTESLLKEQETELENMKKDIEGQLENHEKNLKVIKKKEKSITNHLDDKLSFKFERIIKSKGGDGIVPVKNNVCNGCHMILPLQFINGVRMQQEIYHCPYCSRILYHDDSDIVGIEIEETAGLQDLFEDDDFDFEDDFSVEEFELYIDDKDNIGSDSYMVPSEDNEEEDEDNIDIDINEEDEENEEDTEDMEDVIEENLD